jgi:hypothetical protein
MLLELFHKIETDRMLLSPFSEASITLKPKQNKDMTKKRKL